MSDEPTAPRAPPGAAKLPVAAPLRAPEVPKVPWLKRAWQTTREYFVG